MAAGRLRVGVARAVGTGRGGGPGGHVLVAGATLLLLAVAAIALTRGAAAIPMRSVVTMLIGQLPFVGIDSESPEAWRRIVFDVRLPRVVGAGLVGAALGYSGGAYQGVFRNPLAEPYLLGVAAGAALGASIAIVSPLDSSAYGIGWVPAFAFIGAGAAVLLVYLFARTGAAVNNATLILAGVALSAIFASITSFLLLTGGAAARPILSFLFGGFNTISWQRIAFAVPYFAAGTAVVAVYARVLNVLQLDDEQAGQLGVDVTRVKLIVLAAASLLAATAVALAGVIGFVGLIVPHVTRMLTGTDHRRLLPMSALLGASFLIAADLLARSVIAPQEIPVGIVTSLVGGPFFLYLLRRHGADRL
jgi:iron complex transport system permease protein